MSSSQSVDLGVLNFVLANWDQDVSDETTINNNLKMNGSLALNDVNTLSNNSQFKISQLGLDIDGENANDQSGFSVSTNEDGTIVAIGEPFFDNRGRTRIFRFNGTNWVQLGTNILGTDDGDRSGNSVSLSADGTRVAIYSPRHADDKGQTRIFEYDGTTNQWSRLGENINGIDIGIPNENFGIISLNAQCNRVAISVTDATNGYAMIHEYDENQTTWNQLGSNIEISDARDLAFDGTGDTLLVGRLGGFTGMSQITIYKYQESNDQWNELISRTSSQLTNSFLSSIAMNKDASVIAIGGGVNGITAIYQYDGINTLTQLGGNITQSGPVTEIKLNNNGDRVAMYSDNKTQIYDFDGTNWNQIDVDINSSNSHSPFGSPLSLSGDGNKVVISSPGQNNAGTTQIYEIRRTLDIKSSHDITFNTGSETDNSLAERMRITESGEIKMNGSLALNDVNTLDINSQFKISQLGGDIDGETSDDSSGFSVSLSADGTIVAIGAPYNDENGGASGHVRVYQYDPSKTTAVIDQNSPNFGPVGWTRLGGDIDGELSDDLSGHSVSLSADGTIVAIGAYLNDGNTFLTNDNRGHVRVYQYDNGSNSWNQLGRDIDGENANDQSGHSVSLSADGTIVAIGAIENDGNTGVNSDNRGHVRVYQYDNGSNSWNQLGGDIDGENDGDQSGWSVSLSADGTIVAIGAIGAIGNDGNGGASGHVRVYQYNNDNNSWNQLGEDIDGENAGDLSGHSVSLSADGTIVAIGANLNDGNTNNINDNRGHVRVYQYNNDNNSWNQLGGDIDGETSSDESGWSVSLSADGTIVAIGAYFNDGNTGNTNDERGHVRVYQYDNGSNSWNQLGGDIDGEASEDLSGFSVSLSADGTIVAIGAPYNDENGGASGHVRVYEIRRTLDINIKCDGGITFNTGSLTDNSLAERMRITADGFINMSSNVGIGGATAPELPLAIGDNDTGIDRPADNTLTLKTGGTERMRITDSGEIKMNGSLALNDVNTLSNNSQFKISQLGLDIDGENANDQSGFSVSTNEDGTIVAIGEPFFDNRGRTRIFRFNGTIWQSLGNNIVGEVGDLSGSSVSLSADGNRVAIGAPGRDSEQETLDGVSLPVISQGTTRIFEYNETNNEWDQLGDDIDGEDSNIINGAEFTGRESGKSVSLNADGNRVAIGAPIQSTGRGSTRIFEYDGLNNRWIQMGGNIIYANNFENSGKSVSLSADGTIVAIGADGSSNNGRTSIFQYDNENNIWTQLGDDIDGNESDNSGSSVSLNANGNRVAIGAPGHNTSQGTTRIFEYNEANNQWNQLGTNEDGSPQDLDGINTNELSGNSVSLSADGNRIAIGSPFALNILDKKGIMRVYEFNGIRWNQIDVDINGELNADRNGTSVSLSGDGNKVVVGAPGHDSNKGTARVYEIRRTLDIKSDGGITFNTGSETDNSLTERMHITTDGFINMSSNVGIGGATAPAIPLAIGDDDTGIDHPEDNTLTLKTGGFERMRITDEGEVKIQSETPYLTLKNTTEENTDGGAESKLIFQDHSDTTLAQIEASHEGTEDDTKGQLVLSTNDGTNLTERMRVTAGGNIGIAGATAPALSLAIGDNDTGIDHPADDTLTLRTGGFERMRIAANGFVGISQQNITNPSNFLHIKGDPSTAVNANNYASENGFGQIHIETVSNFVNAGNQGTSKLKIGIQQTEDNNAPTSYLQCINDNTIAGKLLLNPAGGNVCTGAGNVGIGTTNPDGGKLHIMGNIYLVHGLVTNSFFAARTEAGNGKPEGEGRFILRWKDRVDTNKTENVEIVMNNNGVETACGFFQGSGNPNNAINFTGQHRCILNKNIDETSYGLIVSSNGKYVNTNNTLLSSINESLPLCSLTNMDNDKKVFGVISEKEDSNDLREFGSGFVSQFKKANKNEQRVFINSLGEGAVWVCDKNGILENGDYISSSSVTGYGMKQTVNGGLLCNFTVGKITCDCNFSLTKVVKQKLKTNVVIDTDGKEQTEIDYDVDGNVQYEDDLDSEGNQQMVYPLETRFLQADGTQLADEAEYNTRKAEGEDVYIACFVGCTYHCG